MSLVSVYRETPIEARLGEGSYTYKCVLDTDETGIIKIELFADSVEQAMSLASGYFGAIVSFDYIGSDIISLVLAPYSSGTCLLYM